MTVSDAPRGALPMSLYATWDSSVRTPSTCVPRVCSFKLTRLVVNCSECEATSIVVAVKMHGAKRTLRSNEISLPSEGILDLELRLSFSVQYPHFIKKGNELRLMIQRRKKYKNRRILGYKTLADGVVNMNQILQRESGHLELDLRCVKGAKIGKVAKLSVEGLSSQPIDYEMINRPSEIELEEDDESTSDGSDSGDPRATEPRRAQYKRRGNFKQKFKSLMRKFKVHELATSSSRRPPRTDVGGDVGDLMSDFASDSDLDGSSVTSNPRPSLRPFFSSSSSSLAQEGGAT